jgi:hypothetical protein
MLLYNFAMMSSVVPIYVALELRHAATGLFLFMLAFFLQHAADCFHDRHFVERKTIKKEVKP